MSSKAYTRNLPPATQCSVKRAASLTSIQTATVTDSNCQVFPASIPYLCCLNNCSVNYCRVNISSVAGRVAQAGAGVYNATKWAVCGLSEALRQEVHSDKIRVTIIEPGAVATELTNHITDSKAQERINKWIESIKPLESEDIAAAIVYAVSQPLHVNVNEILIRPTDQ